MDYRLAAISLTWDADMCLGIKLKLLEQTGVCSSIAQAKLICLLVFAEELELVVSSARLLCSLELVVLLVVSCSFFVLLVWKRSFKDRNYHFMLFHKKEKRFVEVFQNQRFASMSFPRS